MGVYIHVYVCVCVHMMIILPLRNPYHPLPTTAAVPQRLTPTRRHHYGGRALCMYLPWSSPAPSPPSFAPLSPKISFALALASRVNPTYIHICMQYVCMHVCIYIYIITFVYTLVSATALASELCAIVPEKNLRSRSRSSG